MTVLLPAETRQHSKKVWQNGFRTDVLSSSKPSFQPFPEQYASYSLAICRRGEAARPWRQPPTA